MSVVWIEGKISKYVLYGFIRAFVVQTALIARSPMKGWRELFMGSHKQFNVSAVPLPR
jgi:hypothetical protein